MFAPDTVAFEFWGITIWHHDPCVDGSDDSCGWSYPRLSKIEKERADDLIDNEVDNIRCFFGEQQVRMVGDKAFFENVSRDEQKRYVCRIFEIHKRMTRKWWQHPRWHFWHWRFQIRIFNYNFCLWNTKKDRSLSESVDW